MHVAGFFLLLLPLLFFPVRSSSVSGTLERIQTSGSWMVDPAGRVHIFHGFNSVRKGPPWYDDQILNETRLDLYRSWGFNVVRLGAMWKGIEPGPGDFNATFILFLQSVVRLLEKYGMYAILDVHQDVLSSSFEPGGYEGVPRWLVDRFPPSPHPYPWPLNNVTEKNWAEGYLTEAVSFAFQQIYDNEAGAVDYMSRFWTEVADAFKSQRSVLGYELINEPWAGDFYARPGLLLPGEAGKLNLSPLYDRLAAGIRTVDKETMIFFEPVTWGVFLNGKLAGTGFQSVPGGLEYRNRSVLSYHYYCWILDPDKGHSTYSWANRVLCDAILGPLVMPTILEDVRRIGGSAFLTEFGLCSPDGNPDSVDTTECRFVLSQADKHLQSWTYWDSEFFDVSGDVDSNVIESFSRVYAYAVAGIPLYMNFDLETKSFHLDYLLDSSISAPTEIFVPLFHYPDGFLVSTSKELNWNFAKDSRILYVLPQRNVASRIKVFVDIFAL